MARCQKSCAKPRPTGGRTCRRRPTRANQAFRATDQGIGRSAAMGTTLPLRAWTVEEHDRMLSAGALGEDDRVELIEGEIVQMAPVGPGTQRR